MATAAWIMCIFVVTSAANLHKQKTPSTAATKNSTITRDFYLTQQHILQHTRHHNLIANKSKVMKHDDDIQMATMQSHDDENDSVKPVPLTKFPLKNIPLYHAYYHQHNGAYNSSNLPPTSLRNRSAIRKRASSGEKQISTNITMVLEGLLKSYKSNYLPTHGKGEPTVVKTNILIRSMGPISELDMEYSMDCYFRQYWRDSRLKFQGPMKTLSLSIKMLDKIWKPDSTFFNGKHSYVHTITVPNKLLRLTQEGDILYSMRLTIKASCPMELRTFPMDRQSCPLILGSYAYTKESLVYEWQGNEAVTIVQGMTLSQFDLISMSQSNYTYKRREGEFSVVQVSFNLQRHTGYFLIQVYVPCILIVVLSWVSFWIHREATADRVGLGITTVLTLSTISLDSRTDLPKVRYATALDWFLLMSFFYCIATLLEFAGVHFFTKFGSGEINALIDDEWEDVGETIDHAGTIHVTRDSSPSQNQSSSTRKRNSIICPIYNDPSVLFPANSAHSTMERTTQTEPPKAKRWKQIWLCFLGDDKFRRERQREATEKSGNKKRYINSVSLIDRSARIGFPLSFTILILLYWLVYVTYQDDFPMIKEQGRMK